MASIFRYIYIYIPRYKLKSPNFNLFHMFCLHIYFLHIIYIIFFSAAHECPKSVQTLLISILSGYQIAYENHGAPRQQVTQTSTLSRSPTPVKDLGKNKLQAALVTKGYGRRPTRILKMLTACHGNIYCPEESSANVSIP